MNPRLFWIPGPWKGRLAITSRPRGGDWLDGEIAAWSAAGIGVVVSLLEPHEVLELELAEEHTMVLQAGMYFHLFPVPDRGVPGSLADWLDFLRILDRRLMEGSQVAVHCRQSVGRSSLVAAGLLVISGTAPDVAVSVVSTARGIAVPETAEQLAWIQRIALSERPVQ